MKILKILKSEFIREGQVIIVPIRKPKGIGETSEEKLKELTDFWSMDMVEAASP
jgi:hypothetical protein